MTADTEKWKARATELWENCSHSRDLIDSTAAALAEAYEAGQIDMSKSSYYAGKADEREAQQELDAQLCDIAAAGHDEAFAAADRDPALTETQREAIKDRIAARSRTASGLATAIRARQSREQKP